MNHNGTIHICYDKAFHKAIPLLQFNHKAFASLDPQTSLNISLMINKNNLTTSSQRLRKVVALNDSWVKYQSWGINSCSTDSVILRQALSIDTCWK